MSYEPTNWKTGDVVTSAKLNKLEQGVAAGSGVLVVTGTYEGDIETLDKTWQEIIDALSSGKIVCRLLVDDNYVDIGYCTGGNWVEPITTGSVRFIMMGANGIEEVAYSTTAKDGYPSHDWSGS